MANPRGKEPIPEQTVRIREEALKRGAIVGLGGLRKNVLKVKRPLRPDHRAALRPFLRGRLRFSTTSHPEALGACYVAS